MASNYPPGVKESDPNAPWNAEEPKYIECEECEGKGCFEYIDETGTKCNEPCHKCKGAGELEDERDFEGWED